MSINERLTMLETAPPNFWIALTEDESRVIGSAATYSEVVELATREGVEDPVLIKTPDESSILSTILLP